MAQLPENGDALLGSDESYVQALLRLASVPIDSPDIEGVLDQLLAVTQEAMVASVAITVTAVEPDRSLTTAASTSSQAREVDQFEYSIDEGPCIDALATNQEQLLEDVATDTTWPRFSEEAAAAGFVSVIGVPLPIGGDTIGALNLYAQQPDGLDQDRQAARRLAGPAAVVLANGSAYRRTHQATTELEAAIAEQAVMNRAIGVLMARRHCGPRTAAELLQATAKATGRTAQEVAHHLAGDEPNGGKDTP